MAEKVTWQSLLINTGIAALGIFITQLQTTGIPQTPKAPKAPKKPKVLPARGAKNK